LTIAFHQKFRDEISRQIQVRAHQRVGDANREAAVPKTLNMIIGIGCDIVAHRITKKRKWSCDTELLKKDFFFKSDRIV